MTESWKREEGDSKGAVTLAIFPSTFSEFVVDCRKKSTSFCTLVVTRVLLHTVVVIVKTCKQTASAVSKIVKKKRIEVHTSVLGVFKEKFFACVYIFSFTNLFIHFFTFIFLNYLFVYFFFYLLIYLSIYYLFICLFSYLFIYIFIYRLFISLFIYYPSFF